MLFRGDYIGWLRNIRLRARNKSNMEKLELRILKSVNKENAYIVERLSELMTESGEKKAITCMSILMTLHERQGSLFVVSKNSEDVAYGFFANGVTFKSFKQLSYFAVEPVMRKQGIGKESLVMAVEKEVDQVAGCCLSCEPHLEDFYETIGFKFKMMSKPLKSGKQLVMLFSSKQTAINSSHNFFQIEIDEVLARKNYPGIKEEYGINLS